MNKKGKFKYLATMKQLSSIEGVTGVTDKQCKIYSIYLASNVCRF